MCAIAGIVNLNGQPVDTRLLRKMNDQLRHRGPDDEGYRVVELAFTLPVTYFIRHGWHKWIVRKAFQDLLPHQVVWRKRKWAFQFHFSVFS